MQYYLCPRCQFKIAQNKHVCQTCGLNMTAYANSAAPEQDVENSRPAVKNVWAKVLGLTGRSKESAQEKPALS
jgi:predicted amidophosphoribosyltransferase